MDSLKSIRVEVVYAKSDEQVLIPVHVLEGTTVDQAIQHSEILLLFPEIDFTKNKVGIFGKLCTLDAVLREHDRIEIYRPLQVDPRQALLKQRAQGKGKKSSA